MAFQMKSFFQYGSHVTVAGFMLWIYIGVIMPFGEVAMVIMGFAYTYITVCIYGMTLEATLRTKSAIYIPMIMGFISFACNLTALRLVEQGRTWGLALGSAVISALLVWLCMKKLKNMKKEYRYACSTGITFE